MSSHRLKDLPRTSASAIEQARQRALDEGLEFVYLGNVPGHPANHTRCTACGRTAVEREGFIVTRNELVQGCCPCGGAIAGVFA